MSNARGDLPLGPVDTVYLHQLSGGDTEFECALATDFLDTVPDLLGRLHGALRCEDVLTARRTLHNLKGCCRSFGAVVMASVCARFEEALDGDSLESPEVALGLYDELLVCFREVQVFVEVMLAGRAA
jgi:HPt (histidine-containing phosphotransfer) domain-containing protein